ncbi:MAG: VCBS repeat-containing protein [Planctomycetota bacterium]|nr:VCBS repeat-containing protein [Planctomycetota bacterium]
MKASACGRTHRASSRLLQLGLGWAFTCVVSLTTDTDLLAQDGLRFREQVITKAVKFGYQLLAVDLNGDGRKDLIAVDETATELAWYENQHPTWNRHVLALNVPRPLNAACWDIDGDGVPEVVLAYRVEPSPESSVGNVDLFKSGKDVRQLWTQREIDRVPTAHRLRWIDPEGDGKKLLLVAPLVGRRYPPLFDDPVPIYLYRPGQWKRELLSSQPQGILHAINPVSWDGSGREQLLSASHLGLHRFEFRGGQWVVTQLTQGDPRPFPNCGSSEVRVGHLGKNRFLAAIEPWHGNQVVVYVPEGGSWKRVVIEDRMENGHALAVGDLNDDGRDEIVSGFRGKGFQLSIYQATDAKGEAWRKQVLDDGGIAAADCVIDDFTGDGRPDIVAIGASTGNLKLYENLGP